MSKKVSTNGRNLVKLNEGIRNKMYKCSAGHNTIGCGHLILANEGHLLNTTLTSVQIDELLDKDLIKVENWLNKNCSWTSQNEFDALASFIFQYGVGFENKYHNSFAILTSGDRARIVDLLKTGFVNIVAGSGKKELLPRRLREIELFLKK